MSAGARERRLVLVVEDDDDLGSLLCRQVEAFGIDARRARTGAEGVRLAAELHPDLVLLDLLLPDVPGGEVLARLRSHPGSVACPIVGTSILDRDQFPAGFDDVLLKPFSRAMLHRVLRVHLPPPAEPA